MKVEVDVRGPLSLLVHSVCVDVNNTELEQRQSSGVVSVKVEVDVLGSLSLIIHTVCVSGRKATLNSHLVPLLNNPSFSMLLYVHSFI